MTKVSSLGWNLPGPPMSLSLPALFLGMVCRALLLSLLSSPASPFVPSPTLLQPLWLPHCQHTRQAGPHSCVDGSS